MPELNFRVAAKALIINGNKLFMMKRRANDPHKPGAWDIPGGRLDPGENPFDGLKRETKEEVNSEIEILMPVGVEHFTRDDGQRITLIMFLCKFTHEDVKLSEEHQEHRWFDIATEMDQIPAFFHKTLKNYSTYINE